MPARSRTGNTPRSRSRGRRQTKDRYSKSPDGNLQRNWSDFMNLTGQEEIAIRNSGMSQMQFERALNFIDVSGDKIVSKVELKGGLMAAGMMNREVQVVLGMFFDRDHETSITLEKLKRKALNFLLLEPNNQRQQQQQRRLMKKTLLMFLSQWEDKLSVFKWGRVFCGVACFLLPLPFALPGIRSWLCNMGPFNNSVYISETFHNSKEQIWPSERRGALIRSLEGFTKEDENPKIHFDLTSLIYRIRVAFKSNRGVKHAEPILIRIAFQRDDEEENTQRRSSSRKKTKNLGRETLKKKYKFITVGPKEMKCKQSPNFVQKWFRELVIGEDFEEKDPNASYFFKQDKKLVSQLSLDTSKKLLFVLKLTPQLSLFPIKARDTR